MFGIPRFFSRGLEITFPFNLCGMFGINPIAIRAQPPPPPVPQMREALQTHQSRFENPVYGPLAIHINVTGGDKISTFAYASIAKRIREVADLIPPLLHDFRLSNFHDF